jgi:AraC-like DNA-binding protein
MFNNALFLLQIAVIVGFSRLVAAAFRRFGQPQVVGEMAAGLAHEIRNLLHTGMLAFASIEKGSVGVSGSTGALLRHHFRKQVKVSPAAYRRRFGMEA